MGKFLRSAIAVLSLAYFAQNITTGRSLIAHTAANGESIELALRSVAEFVDTTRGVKGRFPNNEAWREFKGRNSATPGNKWLESIELEIVANPMAIGTPPLEPTSTPVN